MNVRIAKVEDAKDLLNIYEYYVTNTPITFEYEEARVHNFYTNEAYKLFKKLEFKNLLSKFETGVSNGDIITKIGDHLISSYKEYRAVIMSLSPQNVVEMTVMRFDGTEYKEVILEITAEEAE